ncbi:MAG: hypothetical protein JKY65_33170 [Planctomycetes bacterium]|nr:hypothetical protein [Planctomycetota bacterium]
MNDPQPPPAEPLTEEPGPAPASSPGDGGRLVPCRFALRALVFALVATGAVFALDPVVMNSRLLRRGVLLENAYDLERFDCSEGALLYLGDSVVGWGGDKAGAEHVLPAVAAEASGLPVVDASHPAYGPKCFRAQVVRLKRGPSRPRAVLLGISLASFGPRRAENPSWHFGLRRSLLETGRYLPRRALAVFEQGFGARSQASYAALPVRVGEVSVARVGDLVGPVPADSEDRFRKRLLCDYATDAQQSSEWSETERLFKALASLEIPSVIYLTPYDHEEATRLLRPADCARIRANARALVALAASLGVTLHDHSRALPHSAFDAPPGVTAEHLFPDGRRELIRRLATSLRELKGR